SYEKMMMGKHGDKKIGELRELAKKTDSARAKAFYDKLIKSKQKKRKPTARKPAEPAVIAGIPVGKRGKVTAKAIREALGKSKPLTYGTLAKVCG
ncbi:hypothetical protein GWN42_12365, partial [candidate division KSB1 bacterium]|nr:hypothetical protein [candidate division KSB1 bacterium]